MFGSEKCSMFEVFPLTWIFIWREFLYSESSEKTSSSFKVKEQTLHSLSSWIFL